MPIKPSPKKTQKLHAKVDIKTDRKIRKIANNTGFTISYVVTELLTMAIKTGLAKDIFWLYLTDHSDSFLDAESSEKLEDYDRLREILSNVQNVVSKHEKRIRDLEESQLSMVNGLKQVGKSFPLSKFLDESEEDE